MKITFIFTDNPDLTQMPRGERFTNNFEIPDEAKSLPDIRAQILSIAELIEQFTNANLHISCSDIDLKNYPIRKTDKTYPSPQIFFNYTTIRIYFDGIIHYPSGGRRSIQRNLIIYSPISLPYPSNVRYIRISELQYYPKAIDYSEKIRLLSEQLLALLNTSSGSTKWQIRGFHPRITTKALNKKLRQRSRVVVNDQRKQKREEDKRLAREAKLAERLAAAPQLPLTHGAGRTPGARPGIYNGIRMRSQLEIRFAAELDERGIKWVYEGEALSESSYLVDFYLPDLGVWVEVKGKFEARDRQVLPTVAKYLKAERQHRLLVYTGSGKCCVVNPSGFRDLERKNFWGELLR